MVGREVAVLRPRAEYVDGDRVEGIERETVGNVLVVPGATSAQGEAGRPEGTVVALTLAFPKAYGKSLRGCDVEVDGERYSIVGDPMPCAYCPTEWNRTAEAARADG